MPIVSLHIHHNEGFLRDSYVIVALLKFKSTVQQVPHGKLTKLLMLNSPLSQKQELILGKDDIKSDSI